jgi:hypothetical protein
MEFIKNFFKNEYQKRFGKGAISIDQLEKVFFDLLQSRVKSGEKA